MNPLKILGLIAGAGAATGVSVLGFKAVNSGGSLVADKMESYLETRKADAALLASVKRAQKALSEATSPEQQEADLLVREAVIRSKMANRVVPRKAKPTMAEAVDKLAEAAVAAANKLG